MDNAIFPNKFKAALAAHQVQIGCWCALANPISTEVLGLAGVRLAGAGRGTRAKRRHHAHSAADGPER